MKLQVKFLDGTIRSFEDCSVSSDFIKTRGGFCIVIRNLFWFRELK